MGGEWGGWEYDVLDVSIRGGGAIFFRFVSCFAALCLVDILLCVLSLCVLVSFVPFVVSC